MEMTATGIDALTVRPTFKTRYKEDAPKIIPSTVPVIRGSAVNSRISTPAGIKGLNSVVGSWVPMPTMSGYSFGSIVTSGITSNLRWSRSNHGRACCSPNRRDRAQHKSLLRGWSYFVCESQSCQLNLERRKDLRHRRTQI